jgi:hypothetical protein
MPSSSSRGLKRVRAIQGSTRPGERGRQRDAGRRDRGVGQLDRAVEGQPVQATSTPIPRRTQQSRRHRAQAAPYPRHQRQRGTTSSIRHHTSGSAGSRLRIPFADPGRDHPAAAGRPRRARPGPDRHRQDRGVRAADPVASTWRRRSRRRWCWRPPASWRSRSPRPSRSYAAHLPGFHVLPIYGGQGYGPQLRRCSSAACTWWSAPRAG